MSVAVAACLIDEGIVGPHPFSEIATSRCCSDARSQSANVDFGNPCFDQCSFCGCFITCMRPIITDSYAMQSML